MLTNLVTYGFCIALAIGALFAWANAETKYRRQRKKIYELAGMLKSAQRDLRQMQSRSGASNDKSQRYHSTLVQIGAILGDTEEQTEVTSKIYSLLNGAIPEAIMTTKRPRKRSQQETEHMFKNMKGKLG